METKAHYTLIGAFALAVVLAAIAFVLWIAKARFDQEYDYYTVQFSEAVSGLAKGAAVQFHGIQVGEVRALRLDPDDSRHVLADIRVQGGTPIKSDTTAKLTYQGITGVAVVQLLGGSPDQHTLKQGSATTPPTIIAQSSDLDRLMSGSEDVITSFHETLTRVSALLSEENLHHVSASLANIESLTSKLNQDQGQLGGFLVHADQAALEIGATASELREVLSQLKQWVGTPQSEQDLALVSVVEDVRATLDAVKSVAHGLDATLDENRGALRHFTHNGLPAANESLQALPPLLRRLERVLADFAQQPRDTLLGGGKIKEVEAK